MDDSGGSDPLPLSPITEFERQENVLLREQIANLNWRNLHEYFDGIKKISSGLEAKISAYEEEIHFIRMDLPAKLKQIRAFKKQLAEMREKLVENAEIYARERGAILNKMETDYPDLLEKIRTIMEKRKQYTQLLFSRKMDDFSSDIEMSLHAHDYPRLLKKHVQLVMLTRNEAFQDCSTEEIEEFEDRLDDHVAKINSNLCTALTKDFHAVADEIRFPFETPVDYSGVEEHLEKMREILDCLHEIRPRCEEDENRFTILELLFGLFTKRFRYHFYGEIDTNVPDKPYMYFNEIILWLGSNNQFFSDYVQKVIDRSNSEVLVRGEFQKRMVELAIEKTESLLDSDAFVGNSSLFSRLLDNTVEFETNLNVFGYPPDFPRVISLFCRKDILDVWVQLESDSVRATIDDLILNENAYNNRYKDASDVDEYLVPDFADSFVEMMQAMFHRYRILPDIHVQARFYNLQVLIFDEFRTRLAHIISQADSPWTEPYPQILNALWYIAAVLEEWSDLSEFIRIQNYIGSGNRIRGAFDNTMQMYHHMWMQKVTALVESFRTMISSEIDEYSKQKWFSFTNSKPFDVTPSFCPFLLKVRDLVGKISTSISNKSIKKINEMTCRKVAIVLMEDIVKRTNFNGKGATQMLYDIETSILPLLGYLYNRPNTPMFDITYEPKWIELLNNMKVLALPASTAILLKDEIEKIPEEMIDDRTRELGIQCLTKVELMDRFEQRCDLSIR